MTFIPTQLYAVLFLLMFELAIYLNLKAQVKLFEQIKVIEVQQKQLVGLLDAVPDSVYICTKKSDQSEPNGLFANSGMNHFFSCNVLNFTGKKIKKVG